MEEVVVLEEVGAVLEEDEVVFDAFEGAEEEGCGGGEGDVERLIVGGEVGGDVLGPGMGRTSTERFALRTSRSSTTAFNSFFTPTCCSKSGEIEGERERELL